MLSAKPAAKPALEVANIVVKPRAIELRTIRSATMTTQKADRRPLNKQYPTVCSGAALVKIKNVVFSDCDM